MLGVRAVKLPFPPVTDPRACCETGRLLPRFLVISVPRYVAEQGLSFLGPTFRDGC